MGSSSSKKSRKFLKDVRLGTPVLKCQLDLKPLDVICIHDDGYIHRLGSTSTLQNLVCDSKEKLDKIDSLKIVSEISVSDYKYRVGDRSAEIKDMMVDRVESPNEYELIYDIIAEILEGHKLRPCERCYENKTKVQVLTEVVYSNDFSFESPTEKITKTNSQMIIKYKRSGGSDNIPVDRGVIFVRYVEFSVSLLSWKLENPTIKN